MRTLQKSVAMRISRLELCSERGCRRYRRRQSQEPSAPSKRRTKKKKRRITIYRNLIRSPREPLPGDGCRPYLSMYLRIFRLPTSVHPFFERPGSSSLSPTFLSPGLLSFECLGLRNLKLPTSRSRPDCTRLTPHQAHHVVIEPTPLPSYFPNPHGQSRPRGNGPKRPK